MAIEELKTGLQDLRNLVESLRPAPGRDSHTVRQNARANAALTIIAQLEQQASAKEAPAVADGPKKISLSEGMTLIKQGLDPLRKAYAAQNDEAKRVVDMLAGDLAEIYKDWPDAENYSGQECARKAGAGQAVPKLSEDDICAFQHALQQLEWIASGTTPSRNCDLGEGPNKANIRHAIMHAKSALDRMQPAYGRLLDAWSKAAAPAAVAQEPIGVAKGAK